MMHGLVRCFFAAFTLVGLVACGTAAAEIPGDVVVEHFRADTPPWAPPRASSADLVAVAAEALRVHREGARDGMSPKPGHLDPLAGRAADTLAWIVRVGEADAAKGVDRLADPTFLARCLTGLRWQPPATNYAPGGDPGNLRLTRYLVYAAEGRATPDTTFTHALWALPHDESGLSASEAEARRDTLDRFRYTRQDVSGGVYRAGGAAAGRADPLVWLTHKQHEGALLQGTIAVSLPGEPTQRLYNVHRHNGLPYDRSLRDTRQQRRYWYFRAIDAVRGWAPEPVPGPALRPWVAVAGDLDALGFGRLLALHTADGLRLVVLADTGGAFEGNLNQLDLYTGVYPSHAAFDAASSKVGETAKAWVVSARTDVAECR